MLEPAVIIKNKPLETSEDFAQLRQKGLEYIEKLGSDFWTDYNAHDPGITILELFCYAITDLGYRTSYEVKDLLTKELKGVAYSDSHFHTAREILSTNPVTFDDIRKLIVDVRGIRNAWVLDHDSIKYCLNDTTLFECPDATEGTEGLNIIRGVYDILVEYEEYVQELSVGEPDNTCVDGGYILVAGQGMKFEVEQDLVLTEVSIYPQKQGELTLVLKNAQNEEIGTKNYQVKPEDLFKKTPIKLNFFLTHHADIGRNLYTLEARGEGMRLFGHQPANFPLSLESYIKLLEPYQGEDDVYYFFYDIRVEPPENRGDEILTQLRTGLMDNTLYSGCFQVANDEKIVFDVENALTLEAVHIYGHIPGPVTIELRNGDGVITQSTHTKIEIGGAKQRVPLGWEIQPCQNLSISARSSDVKLYICEEVDFPIIEDKVITLMGGDSKGHLNQTNYYFFDWEISYYRKREEDDSDFSLNRSGVRKEVRRRLFEQRALCEDLVNIQEVKTEEVDIIAEIDLTNDANPEDTLAEIYCILEEHVKPPVRYYTLGEMIEKGRTSDQIFSGPLLTHGFIDDEEFSSQNDRTEIRSSDIVNLLMDVPGVKIVRSIELASYVNGKPIKREPWILKLEEDKFMRPNYNPALGGILLKKNGRRYQTNTQKVAELLEDKRLRNRPVRLKGHENDCPIPIGEFKNLSDFYPMQNDLPVNYLVGSYRVKDTSPNLRKAQSRQLKAYLMFFEQMLANYLAQLANIKELFSWDSSQSIEEVKTYFTQKVDEIVDIADVYTVEYDTLDEDLGEIIESPQVALSRKNKFLDHLIGRFAENFVDYSLLVYSMMEDPDAASFRLIQDKQHFLQNYPEISRNRGQGILYKHPGKKRVLSGFQKKVMRKLGFHSFEKDVLKMERISFRRTLGQGWKFALWDETETTVIFESDFALDQSASEGWLDLALLFGGDLENYRSVPKGDPCEGLGNWQLMTPCTEEGAKQLIGTVYSFEEEVRDEVIAFFAEHETPFGIIRFPELEFGDLSDDKVTIFKKPDDPDGWYFKIEDEGGNLLLTSGRCKSKAGIEQLLSTSLALGASAANYRLSANKCYWELINKCKEPDVIATTPCLEVRKALLDIFANLEAIEGFHVVEHILLRKRNEGDSFLSVQAAGDNTKIPVLDPYSFRVTIALPAWTKRAQNPQFREFVEQTLRMEAPAHVYLNIYWLGFTQMGEFEQKYLKWLDALKVLPYQMNGELPYRDSVPPNYEKDYQQPLEEFILELEQLKQVYPTIRLYDAQTAEGVPQTILGKASLGTN